jgi:pantothenate kinase
MSDEDAVSKPFMVGVVGIPGSGKSTSSEILSALLSNSIVMPMDGYHIPMSELKKFPDAKDAIYRRGAPDTFDPASLEKDLKRIVEGDETQVSIPGFDHAKGDPETDKHTFKRNEHSIVICEGIYLAHQGDGWENIKSYFDWIVYIKVDVDKCIDRLKERNKCIPGYTPEEIEIRCDAVDRVNAETVEKSRVFASEEVISGAA